MKKDRAEVVGKKKGGAEVSSKDAARTKDRPRNLKRAASLPAEDKAAKRAALATVSRSVDSVPRVDVDAPPPDPNDLYQNSAASARFISQFCRPGASPFAHDTFVFPELYSEVALRGVKFFAHVNQLVLDYETESRLDKRRVEDAREIALTAQGKLDEASKKLEIAAREISQLKVDKAKLEKTQKENGDRIKLIEYGNQRRDVTIRRITEELEAATELTETKIFNAVVDAKREFTNKFQSKLSRARGHFEKMKGALEDMVNLSEMVSDLQLIKLLQSDKAPTLEAEAESVAEHIKGLDGADKRFSRMVSDLDKALTLEPVDDLAASVGVAESSGSNQDAPNREEEEAARKEVFSSLEP